MLGSAAQLPDLGTDADDIGIAVDVVVDDPPVAHRAGDRLDRDAIVAAVPVGADEAVALTGSPSLDEDGGVVALIRLLVSWKPSAPKRT